MGSVEAAVATIAGTRARGTGWMAAALCMLAVVTPWPARASAPEGWFVTPAPGAVLTAGGTVEVSWAGLPAGTEEFELLLFLDPGAPSLRLTEQLDPDQGRYSWRVPALPATRARLAIRFNRGGGEEAGPESGCFRIVASSRDTLSSVSFREGEWWVAAGVADALPPMTEQLRCPGAPWGLPRPVPPFAALHPWQDAVAAGAMPLRPAPGRVGGGAERSLSVPRPRRPLTVPLRD